MRKRAWLLAVSLLVAGEAEAEDWPEFRGPDGQGHSTENRLPLTWSESHSVAWKVPVPGRGWSSPVLQGEQIWLTTAQSDGRSLRAVCLDRQTGRLQKNVELFRLDEPGPVHRKNGRASPTPILEGQRVYTHFGAFGTACVSTAGEILWKTVLQYNHRHGPGGSPTLFGDMLVISCDGYDDDQFVVALDKGTGEIRWKNERPDAQHAYSTPLVIQVDGRSQVVSTGADRVVAYDPANGKEIWSSRYVGYSLIPRPVWGHGLVYVCSGYDPPATLYAIRPDGRGDVTGTHVEWTLDRGVPLTPSPLLVDDELYLVSDNGIASCLDAKTGKLHWRHRLGGEFSASPVYADGRIYLLSEDGVTTVVAPGRTFTELAVNRLAGRTLASMAVSQAALYIRTDEHLYCIEAMSAD